MINGKQRAYLRGLANSMEPILHVGKDGIGENLIRQADSALEARELFKGTVLQNSPISAREALDQLCEATGAEPVQTVGNRFVLYRARKKDPEIVLP
jgi:RNA-binding protein